MNSTFEKHKSTVDNLADKYEQLRKGVNISNSTIENKSLSPDKYKEFLDINKQLHENFLLLLFFMTKIITLSSMSRQRVFPQSRS